VTSRVAGLQHLGAHDVGGQVAVAEPEPGRLDAVRRQLLLGVPGLVEPSPAAFVVDPRAEGVHDRVQVGAHLEAEQPDVIGRVGDDHHLVGGSQDAQQAPHEAGTADATGQGRDLHAPQSDAPGRAPRSRMNRPKHPQSAPVAAITGTNTTHDLDARALTGM
jgi:hypothetical protein